MQDSKDQELLAALKANSEVAMDTMFQEHYASLCRTILRILKDPNMSEDIAQEVFLEIWRKRETIQISTSLGAYLRRAATNKALNYLRSQRMKFDDSEFLPEATSPQSSSIQKLEKDELEELIHKTIDALPDRCRAVFALSRFEEMSYQEIANELEISVKTVENQISKALKILRAAIGPYVNKGLLSSLLLILMN